MVELSDTPLEMGSVRPVKILGVLALLDEDETDWKLLALDSGHKLADSIHSLADLETHFPGSVDRVRHWFQFYKTTDGKAENEFAFEGAARDVGLAQAIVWETHASWAALCRGEIPAGELHIPDQVPSAAKGE